ncbi:MAG: GNAT family N-acetyltransferase [Chloroflexi bacterium]|nr:GNAT family N-acetyltransferase [Chloroflexota bacterium]
MDEVAQLIKDAYQQYEKQMPSRVWKAYLEDMMDVRSRLKVAELIVAESNGRVVGSVTLYSSAFASSEEGWPKGWAAIRLLAVHPDYRGWGIGRALMAECIGRCRKWGIRTIGLRTTEVMDIARRMYERLGFVRVPEFDFHPTPDTIVMAYRLDL